MGVSRVSYITARQRESRRYYLKHGIRIRQKVQLYKFQDPERAREAVRKWRKLNPDKVKEIARIDHLRRVYGLSLEEYDALLVRQSGACAICQKLWVSGRNFALDHCHQTGRVRGILCHPCNRMLGWFEKHAKDIVPYLQ